MKNFLVAQILYEIADMLDILGIEFKPQAYRKAAQQIEAMPEAIEDIIGKKKIPGVGKSIEEKIKEIISSGSCKYYEQLKKKIPVDFEDLLKVEGIGPQKIKILYKKLKVKDIDDLERVAKQGRLRKIAGFGEKTEKNILENISFARTRGERFLLDEADALAKSIIKKLRGEAEAVGSIRRGKETIGDIDILTSSPQAMNRFTKLKTIEKVLGKGSTKSSVMLASGIKVDLRVIDKSSWGAALLYFTGSKEHNILLRKQAIKKKFKLSEYGLFSGKKMIAGSSESEVYAKLGMQFIPAELREGKGEIEAALKHKIPALVAEKDIKGDLQMHTTWSDGLATIEKMAKAAKQLGHEYICITDHMSPLGMIHPLDAERIRKQAKEIKKANKIMRVFHGIEVDIKKDGSLAGKDSVLKQLDIVYAAVHSSFRLSGREMTSRIISAMENEHVDIIAHPTGRVLNKRQAYDIDLDKLIDKSKETGTILEINSHPSRLDLNAEHIKRCIERGCKHTLGTDAHGVSALRYIKYGVITARRGWAQKKHIINSFPRKKIERFFGI